MVVLLLPFAIPLPQHFVNISNLRNVTLERDFVHPFDQSRLVGFDCLPAALAHCVVDLPREAAQTYM